MADALVTVPKSGLPQTGVVYCVLPVMAGGVFPLHESYSLHAVAGEGRTQVRRPYRWDALP